jgi:hypothetical protein
MSFSVVQSGSAEFIPATTRTETVTLPGVTAGNSLVAVTLATVWNNAGTAVTVTDGTVFLSLAAAVSGSVSPGLVSVLDVSIRQNVAAGSHAVSASLPAGATGYYGYVVVFEVAGLGLGPLDVSVTATGLTGAVATGSTAAVASVNEFALAAFSAYYNGATTITQPAGYSNIFAENTGASGGNVIGSVDYKSPLATGAQSAAWGTPTNYSWVAALVVLKPPGAPLGTTATGETTVTATLIPSWSATFSGVSSFSVPGILGALAAGESAMPSALTNYASVTLAAPLYMGLGGILDPYLWEAAAPQVGTLVFYDPTNITIASSGEIVATVQNFSAVVGFFDPTAGWVSAILVYQATNVSYAQGESSLTGTLSGAAQHLAASGAALSSLLATISTSIPLDFGAGGQSSLTASLANGAALAMQAAAQASLVVVLTTSPQFGLLASAVSSLSARMLTVISLLSSAVGVSRAQGSLSSGIALQAAISGKSALIPAFSGAASFGAHAYGESSFGAALSTTKPLAALAGAESYFTGQLTVGRLMTAIASGNAGFSATLSTGAGFSARIGGRSTMTPGLFYGINLASVFSCYATFDPELTTLQLLTTAVMLENQIPGIYQPGAEPWGQFAISAGRKGFYAIDWTYWLVYKWQPGFVAPLGYVIRPFPWTGYEYVVTTAGETGNYPPVWPTTLGATVTDGSAIWTSQAVSADSLIANVVEAAYSAPAGIVATAYLPQGNITPVLIDATQATPLTAYQVTCTMLMNTGEFMIGQMVFDINASPGPINYPLGPSGSILESENGQIYITG